MAKVVASASLPMSDWLEANATTIAPIKSKELASYLASSCFTNHFSLITDHSGIRVFHP